MTFPFLYSFLCSLELVIVLFLCLVFCMLIILPCPDCPPVKIFSQYMQTHQVFYLFRDYSHGTFQAVPFWIGCHLSLRHLSCPCLYVRSLFAESHACLFIGATSFWSTIFSGSTLKKGAGEIHFVRSQINFLEIFFLLCILNG